MNEFYLTNLLKKLIEFLYKVKRNKFIILFLIKPFNTWIVSIFYDESKAIKDADIWKNQRYYKSEFYKELETPLQKYYIEYIENNTSKKDKILDICCNQGRHLKGLHNLGYQYLYGVDIMDDAINILKESKEYSEGGILAESDMAQLYIKKQHEKFFDYAITYSATIELINPGFKIFEELYRILKKGFIFVLNENGHSYPRFYRYQIKSSGFKIKNIEKLSKSLKIYHCLRI